MRHFFVVFVFQPFKKNKNSKMSVLFSCLYLPTFFKKNKNSKMNTHFLLSLFSNLFLKKEY